MSLLSSGHIHHVISQNVDGLHLRSGIKARDLTELHGNIFMETCMRCGNEYFRRVDIGGMGLRPTGNVCSGGEDLIEEDKDCSHAEALGGPLEEYSVKRKRGRPLKRDAHHPPPILNDDISLQLSTESAVIKLGLEESIAVSLKQEGQGTQPREGLVEEMERISSSNGCVEENSPARVLRKQTIVDPVSIADGDLLRHTRRRGRRDGERDVDDSARGGEGRGVKKSKSGCGGPLRDCTIDWDTPLPEDKFKEAERQIRRADLVITLGTSLRIRPAGNMPALVFEESETRLEAKSPPVKRGRRGEESQQKGGTSAANGLGRSGQLVVVNLQRTHLDSQAALVIHGYCDDVMKELCRLLRVQILVGFARPRPPLPASLSSSDSLTPDEDLFVSCSSNTGHGSGMTQNDCANDDEVADDPMVENLQS